ncbi:hypothetical protein [Enterobacter vonholyi]
MSTITKEWLQKAISQHESMRDETPFGLDEDDSNTLAAMKLALASLEAEPVAHLYSASFERGHVEGELTDAPGCDMPVYSAPPATVSVPDELKEFLRLVECMLVDYRESNLGNAREWIRHISSASDAFEDAHSLSPWLWVRTGRLAAMFQGAEPVTTAYKLPLHVYRELVNSLRDTAVKYQGCQQLREQLSRTLQEVIEPAAPQQEVK